MNRRVFGCISGGGPGITYLAGAAAALDASCKVQGWSGASAGALIAAAKAFHVPDEDIQAALVSALNGSLIKPDFSSVALGGVLDWSVLGTYVDRMIGKGKRMRDAELDLVVCVTDLDRRRPMYISKRDHGDVKVKEAVMASSAFMAMVTPACHIPSLGTPLSPDVRLFVDGGWTDNTVDGVWDRRTDPRVLLRLAPPDDVHRVRPGNITGIHAAVLQSALWAASLPKSHRTDGLVVDVNGVNDWDFTKTPDTIDAEWSQGYDSAKAAVAVWHSTESQT